MTIMDNGDTNEVPQTSGGDERIELGELDDYIGFHLRLAQTPRSRPSSGTPASATWPGWFAVMMLVARQSGHHADGAEPRQRPRQVDADPVCATWRAAAISSGPVPHDKRSYALA